MHEGLHHKREKQHKEGEGQKGVREGYERRKSA